MSDALERGLDVLEILADQGEVRASELMTTLQVSRATIFRLMTTLERRGYVERARVENAWRLGRMISELGASLDSGFITQLAAPALADLRASTLETINLAVVQGSKMVWAATVPGAHALRQTITVGEQVAIHSTGVGKAVLSVLPDSEWSRFLGPEPLKALTDRTLTSYGSLRADVDEAAEQGWVLEEEESEVGGVCLAAPVLDRQGRPIAAISVSSVVGRVSVEDRESVGKSIVRWSEQLSAEVQGTDQSSA